MKQVYDAGIRTVCFISPVFPGITDFEAIFQRVKDQCDLVWLENLNLRGGFKQDILDYIADKYPPLLPLYHAIYNKGDHSYFQSLEKQAEQMAKENGCLFVDNELPYGRAEPGHPVIVDYFYHEEIRGSGNTENANGCNAVMQKGRSQSTPIFFIRLSSFGSTFCPNSRTSSRKCIDDTSFCTYDGTTVKQSFNRYVKYDDGERSFQNEKDVSDRSRLCQLCKPNGGCSAENGRSGSPTCRRATEMV